VSRRPPVRTSLVGAIEPVGNTTVVGLGAKSVVDIMAPVRSLAASRPGIDAAASAGYLRVARVGVLVVTLLLQACAAGGPRPPKTLPVKKFAIPADPAVRPAATFGGVEAEVTALQRPIGGYPPRLESEEERDQVYARWSRALVEARSLEPREDQRESKLYLLSELYRQGHNLDVDGAASAAFGTLEECLEAYPRSRPCNLSASYFYLSTSGIPDRLDRAERSLNVLSELAAPGLDQDAEAGFVWLALYRGNGEEANRRIDRYVDAFPHSPRVETFRKIRDAKKVFIKSAPPPP
jgi:hypothetical protein